MVGDAGIGKTTLVDAAAARAVRDGAAVLAGRGQALGAGIAYGPLAGAIGRYLHALDPPERAQLVEGLGSLGRLVEGLDEDPTTGSPELERSRLFQSVALLLARLARQRPVVLVLDDLHWADAATVELVAYLAAELLDEPVALLLAMRPDDLAPRPDIRALLGALERRTETERVTVEPFTGGLVGEAMAVLLGGPVTEGLRDAVLTRTGGLPLAVDALTRDLRERSVLDETPAGWHAPDDALAVPGFVVDLFAARLAKLPPPERDLIATVAVADHPVAVSLLATVCSLTEGEVVGHGRRLADRRFAAVTTAAGEPTLEAAHPLVAEAAAGLLAEGERRRLHHAFATVLAGSGDALLDVRARHVVEAGSLVDGATAVDVLERAGRRAMRRGATDARDPMAVGGGGPRPPSGHGQHSGR